MWNMAALSLQGLIQPYSPLTKVAWPHKFKDMKKDKEPKVWVTLLALVLGVLVLVALVGFALWYSEKTGIAVPTPSKPVDSWGIANDSPIRSKP